MHLNILTKAQKGTSLLIASILLAFSSELSAEDAQFTNDLLNQYISSKGDYDIITFDASNIKQFWIEKTVSSKDNNINILLPSDSANGNESVPLKIQLANVNEAQDCKIEIISETEDYSFSVLDSRSKVLSSSKKENDFLNYHIASSIFHLEDTQNISFNLKFTSKSTDTLSIKKIILSFFQNQVSSFLASPGVLKVTGDMISTNSEVSIGSDNSFSVTGTQSTVLFSKKIYISDGNMLSSSFTIKNTGDKNTRIYTGYALYMKDHLQLLSRNYSYKNINKVLKVLSISEDNKSILVDSYPEWEKGCFLAINAKADMSDVPNTSLGGTIAEIKQLNDGQAEIILNKPLAEPLKAGELVRVNGKSGTYLYTSSLLLRPGEEKQVSSTIKQDNDFFKLSKEAFSRNVYYVVPVIRSFSTETNAVNTVLIRDFTISY